MYREMSAGIICLMLFGATFFVPKVRADEFDKKTIGTVNEPIQVTGKVLPAGTYVLKLLDSNDRTLVAIYNADGRHLITTIQGIPDYRMETPSEAILQLEERPEGQPEAPTQGLSPVANFALTLLYPTHTPQ